MDLIDLCSVNQYNITHIQYIYIIYIYIYIIYYIYIYVYVYVYDIHIYYTYTYIYDIHILCKYVLTRTHTYMPLDYSFSQNCNFMGFLQ